MNANLQIHFANVPTLPRPVLLRVTILLVRTPAHARKDTSYLGNISVLVSLELNLSHFCFLKVFILF